MPYGTVLEANTYHQESGNTAWAGFEEPARVAAITIATFYIDGVYGNRFNGIPAGPVEEWPRIGATDRYSIPVADGVVIDPIKHAAFTVALFNLSNPGILWRVIDPSTQVKSQTTGPLKKEFFKFKFNDPIILESVEAILRRFLTRISAGPLVVGGG